MTTTPHTATAPRLLNHMEFVHRPGERALVLELFALLGFECHDGMFLVAAIDPPRHNLVDNMLAGSEVRPEQWAFDQALGEALRSEPLGTAFDAYQALLERAPQYGMHVGIRFDSLALGQHLELQHADLARAGSHARTT